MVATWTFIVKIPNTLILVRAFISTIIPTKAERERERERKRKRETCGIWLSLSNNMVCC